MFDPNQLSPLKPNDSASRLGNVDKNRPSRLVTSEKKFKDVLAKVDEKDDQEGTVPLDEVDEEGSSRSIFEISASHSKKPTLKPSMLPPGIAKQKGLSDQAQESSVGFTGRGISTTARANNADEDEELQLARTRRFEIPTGSPDDEDMLALNEAASLAQDSTKAQDIDKQMSQIAVQRDPRLLARDVLQAARTDQGETDRAAFASTKAEKATKSDEKGKTSGTLFSQEKADLAYINPVAAQPIFVDAKQAESRPEISRNEMQALINKIVDGMQTVQRDGVNETVIDLRHPPVLEGARLVLTSPDQARNEFRIAFTNLSDSGKLILDAQIQRDNLKGILENQGFVIHAITTTQNATITPIDQTSQQGFARQGDDKQQKQQQRRGQNPQEENA